METNYNPHELEWTDEKVSRFWNFRNNHRSFDDTWFTQNVGDALLQLVKKHVPLKGEILDYGTGKGFLLDQLLNKYSSSIQLHACDFTEDLAKEADNKFKTNKSFKGCLHIKDLPSAYKNDCFDLIFLIETIEHLTDKYLDATLKETYRILKPGGSIVITTPNDESLEKHHVHCADCGATFHFMQHVRKWDINSLKKATAEFGYQAVMCKDVNIKWFGNRGIFHYGADKLKSLFAKPYNEHLVYIGKKK
jgi:ubiquinone/menaquinone biosynthesis C-methylase UbiE